MPDREFTIAKFSPELIEDIMRIENLSFGSDAYAPEKFEFLYAKVPETFLVAWCQGKPVSYIAGIPEGDMGYIDSMATHPEFRRKGIGSGIMLTLAEIFARQGVSGLCLHVRTTNFAAIRFYERHGFMATRSDLKYYSDGAAAYYMIKAIR